MPWNATCPDGTKSVKDNRPVIQDNTTYVEDTMGKTANDTTNTNVIRDHYWNVSATLDGRHRFINSPAFTIAGAAADPVLGSGMGGVSYFKTKSAADSPDNQDVQPFFRNAGGIEQLLGIRAMLVFDLGVAAPNTLTVKYAHNINLATLPASIPAPGLGIDRFFTMQFTTALPSNNYFVHGFAIPNNTSGFQPLYVFPPADNLVGTSKKTTEVKMVIGSSSAAISCPLQVGVICFGG